MISLLIAAALAGGTYHPDDIAAQSEAFARASEAAPKYEEAESTSRMVAQALTVYEENLDLLGDRAPATERERHAELKKAYGREKASLAAFAGDLMGDFDQVFTEAMERAVGAHPDAVMCERMLSKGGLPGMPAKQESNPECKGDDLSASIAAAMDADAVLSGAVDELVARNWPVVTTPADSQAPLSDAPTWISVDGLFKQTHKDALRSLRQQDEDARLPIAAALEEGADPATQLDAARAITETTAASRASLAAPLWAAIDKAAAKRAKKGKDPLAFCANPVELGGCTGTNGTSDGVESLLADKKVAKALR